MLIGHIFEEQLFRSRAAAHIFNLILDSHNGIDNNYKNGMAITTNGTALTVQSGMAIIQGREIEEDSSTTLNAGGEIAYCKLVIEIDLDKQNTDTELLQTEYKIIKSTNDYPSLTQNDIVNNNSGKYQYELARFRNTTSGITDFQDMRTFIDIDSIYRQINEHIGDIDNEKIFLPVGAGCDYFGATLPNENYMWADGSAISRTEYPALFATIGTIYGEGDGSTTFNLPDKRNRTSVMRGSGTFANLGGKVGSEKHTLTAEELPNTVVAAAYNTTGQGWRFGNGGTPQLYTTGNLILGKSKAFSVTQPSLVCNYIIRVK